MTHERAGPDGPLLPDLAFLAGGGDMGRRIRQHDWSATPLGAPQGWPQPLRWALSICLQSSFPTAIYWGGELRLLYNDTWAPIPGDRHPDALGRPAREVWPDIWHVIEPQFRKVLETGRGLSTYDQLLPMQRGSGVEETYWNYSFTPIRDEHGAIVGVFNQGNETTSRVIAARERRREVDRLREWFEQAPGAVAVLEGPQHVFEVANAAYLRLVGDRDVLGKPVAHALPEVVGQGFIELLDGVFRRGEPYIGQSMKVTLQHRPGAASEERVLDFVYQPISSATGEVTGIFVQATDVTERASTERALRESEAALLKADRHKDEFLAVLGHELRNPLASLRTGLDLLEGAPRNLDVLDRVLPMMGRQFSHLVRLVDDLLDISRVSTGRIELQSGTLDLNTPVQSAIEQTRPLLDARYHRLRLRLDPNPLPVLGDFERLTQVVANLLSNAAKYTEPGGLITVTTGREEDRAVLAVEDSGVGIAPERHDKLFKMFSQISEHHDSTGGGGLGIGLALSRHLITMHGGTLDAVSEGLGRGSRFLVVLPVSTAAADAGVVVREGAPEPAPEPAPARRVLVVDDNADAAEGLRMLLQMQGQVVEVAYDGEQALEKIEQFRPEVVLLDLGLPGMNGIDVAMHARAMPVGRDLTLVALTGWGQEEDRKRTREAGFDHHLAKPADASALLQLLAVSEPSAD